ncbi:MAG TPA: type III pantothenate kinase, partial [Cytophagales bacterium]|nr:type III pantothenate kinase [Cytophagales bacterium]
AYKTPHSLGADRLAAVVGGIHLCGETSNLLVIQLGTCFTYDFVTGITYNGGGISPGPILRFRALKDYTAKLPLVEMDQSFAQLVGSSTEDSIKSGVINGCIAELEGIIDRYVDSYPDLKVILTGGWTNYFDSKINRTKFAFQDLVLVGLNKILIHNNV